MTEHPNDSADMTDGAPAVHEDTTAAAGEVQEDAEKEREVEEEENIDDIVASHQLSMTSTSQTPIMHRSTGNLASSSISVSIVSMCMC